MKYAETELVFREVPDEVTVAINITNCPHHCKGCHSKHLWEDIGETLDADTVDKILADPNYQGATCVGFMGGDAELEALFELNAEVRKRHTETKTCWYTGYTYAELEHLGYSHRLTEFDYVKIGPYIEELGPIDREGSNQVMFMRTSPISMKNITTRFRKKI